LPRSFGVKAFGFSVSLALMALSGVSAFSDVDFGESVPAIPLESVPVIPAKVYR
jgi:hypothetical protein